MHVPHGSNLIFFFITVELGYCLRGENCPYSHGTNVVAINDFDKLQQFNMPLPAMAGVGSMQPGGTSTIHYHVSIVRVPN